MKLSPLTINLGPVPMSCTADEIGATLAALLDEMRAVIPMLRHDEREVLRRIMSHDGDALAVGEVFPDFSRESEAHKTLRRLRAAQFVRPAVHGRWDPEEPILVKPFARLMWDHLGEAEIFQDAAGDETPAGHEVVVDLSEPAEAEKPAVDPEDVILNPVEDDDVIDLAGDEAAEPAEAAQSTGEWNEEAILEYLRDSPEDERA